MENAEQLFAWFSDQVTKKKGMDGSSEFCKCIIICAKNIGGNKKKGHFYHLLSGIRQTLSRNVVSSSPRHERDSNSKF